ncbi:Dimeric alpha-beta barrel [Niveomyces insectorum RCEF 264]|uniref:Dimeric alpha-beta barrel n=1 Tax=Niveomyces insectorum RCEF 264 TaxID=1081102 RepID=A0A167XTY9_9HYPO|nr:Dimeric alpha-beta barrel [Niveomyces insectorum RCEF 264]
MSDPGYAAAKANLPLPAYQQGEAHPAGMLFVLTSVKDSKVDQETFDNWYDTDHLPLRRSCPGISGAARYRGNDDKVPEWLATYDLESLDVLESEPYKAQWAAQPEWEKQMLADLSILDRRVYRFLTRSTVEGYATKAKEGHVFQYVGLEPSAQLGPAELDRWYAEEHVPLLSSVPGWLRSTRWELVDAKGAAGSRANSNEGKIPQFLAIHEWESPESFKNPDFKRAISTEWRNSVMDRQNKEKEERRTWKLHKKF